MRGRGLLIHCRSALAILCVLTAGCGGGGGGGGNSGPPPNATLQGTIELEAGAPAVSYLAKLDAGNEPSARTNGQGVFQMPFDATSINGNQIVLIYDSNGALVDEQPITISAGGGVVAAGTIIVGPPPPP
jgi:hypothetical protein